MEKNTAKKQEFKKMKFQLYNEKRKPRQVMKY